MIPTVYYSFTEMIGVHFLIGVGAAVCAVVWSFRKQHDRRMFAFGTGFGQTQLWLRWYLIALFFEFISSLFAPSSMFYYELGMSVIQAGAFVVGAFIVDRLAGAFEGPAPTRYSYSTGHRPSFADRTRARKEEKTHRDEKERSTASGKFADLTRGR